MYTGKQISYVFHTTLFIEEKKVFLFINIVLWLKAALCFHLSVFEVLMFSLCKAYKCEVIGI